MNRRVAVRSWSKLSLQVWIGLLAGLSGCAANSLFASPVDAQTVGESIEPRTEIGSSVPLESTDNLAGQTELQEGNLSILPASVSVAPAMPQLSELQQPATTVEDWIAQIEASLVQITEVRVEATEAGLQVILETENGVLDVPETRSIGNALIADIPNATLAEEFSQAEPIAGIALVNVTQLPGDKVRIAITGTDAPPTAQIRSESQQLVLSVTIGSAADTGEEDAIQVVVTGEQDEGYNPSSASTATRTDTPLRDIPTSIQVIPRQVLEDRNVRDLAQATETVSGVVQRPLFGGALSGDRIIRGFPQEGNFRNGFRDVVLYGQTPIGTIEQVEVLRGPASVLFGQVEPGGIINVITRQPLSNPYYNLAFEAGNFGFYQPSIDLSGPLTEDDTLLYRFIAAYQGAESFQDFVETETITIAPSITLNLGERTRLNLYYEYAHFFGDPPRSPAPLLSDGSLPPRSFYPRYPDLISFEATTHKFGYILNHEFSDNWQIRNNIAVSLNDFNDDGVFFNAVEDDRFLTNFQAEDREYANNNYFGQIDLLGKFNTGSISHQLLMGFDYNRLISPYQSFGNITDIPPLDILDPDYDIPRPEYSLLELSQGLTQSYGVYLQDQIAFSDSLKLLIGGRYDWISSEFEIFGDGTDSPLENDGAFSPRIGLVYQPSDTVSLYASYSRSFVPTGGRNADGERFEPSRGTQYEVGVKTDWLDGRLSATLAAYHLTKTNITTTDPDDPLFSVQTGEARSQGIELDVTGEILPGWNVTASYAYTDAEVTEDNTTPVGNRLPNVPENQASLWTTYTIQTGDLEGLGFGLGLFYVGAREGDLANSFQSDDYLRTDAAVYYRRGRFRGAVNIRNLFNITYADASFGRNLITRGDPLTVTASVSWDF